MKIEYLSRFDRSFRNLESRLQKEIQKTIENLLKNLTEGTRPQGLGLRRLKGSIWEIRVGLKIRILFELGKNRISFILAGNHDEVTRFLKSF